MCSGLWRSGYWLWNVPFVNRYWADEQAFDVGYLPTYHWFHARQQAVPFHETHPDPQMKAVMDDLLSKTWLTDLVSELHRLIPLRHLWKGLVRLVLTSPWVCAVWKLSVWKNSDMWSQYRAAQQLVAARGSHCWGPGRTRASAFEGWAKLSLFVLWHIAKSCHVHSPAWLPSDDVWRHFRPQLWRRCLFAWGCFRSRQAKQWLQEWLLQRLLRHATVGPEKAFDSTIGTCGDPVSGMGIARPAFVISDRSLNMLSFTNATRSGAGSPSAQSNWHSQAIEWKVNVFCCFHKINWVKCFTRPCKTDVAAAFREENSLISTPFLDKAAHQRELDSASSAPQRVTLNISGRGVGAWHYSSKFQWNSGKQFARPECLSDSMQEAGFIENRSRLQNKRVDWVVQRVSECNASRSIHPHIKC